MEVFEALNSINVNGHTEKKKTGNAELTYLSWPFAWAEVKKRYPDAHYEVEKFNGLPYVFDPATGYLVYTTVTIEGVTHEMWLPVMDGSNKAMKDKPYTYTSGYGQYQKEKTVEAATMFDVNKTIMRCLVKNLAMFGLGLYIYAGEDLPEGEKEEPKPRKKSAYQERLEANYPADHITEEEAKNLTDELVRNNAKLDYWLGRYGVKAFIELTPEQMVEIYGAIDDYKRNKGQADS